MPIGSVRVRLLLSNIKSICSEAVSSWVDDMPFSTKNFDDLSVAIQVVPIERNGIKGVILRELCDLTKRLQSVPLDVVRKLLYFR
jgi:hypothetical protein